MTTLRHPTHEQLLFSAFLAAASGSIDAYTYLLHGKVFASLQTGNFISLGMHIGAGEFMQLPHFFLPILAFACGTILARGIQVLHKDHVEQRKRSLLGLELSILTLVGLFSTALPNDIFNSFLSVAAAIQLLEFQRMKGKPFTALMMTGNLRNLAVAFYDGFFEKHPERRQDFRDILVILLSFVAGAALNSFFAPILGNQTIYLSVLLLLIPFLLLSQPQFRSKKSQA